VKGLEKCGRLREGEEDRNLDDEMRRNGGRHGFEIGEAMLTVWRENRNDSREESSAMRVKNHNNGAFHR